MTELVLDTQILNETLNEITRVMKESRKELDRLIDKNKNSESYGDLSRTKDLARLYGECADDYSKLSFLHSGVSESIMDLRKVRRDIVREKYNIAPSLLKNYKSRIDTMIEELTLFKEAIQSARQGMEARVRYFNSCTYLSYDKIIGAKC